MPISETYLANIVPPEPGVVSQRDLVATAQYDIAKAIRRLLENRNINKVVEALIKRPMGFSELREETKLKTNDLNHALLEMKNIGLVTQLNDKKYSRTIFCTVILEAMQQIKENFAAKKESMFLPVVATNNPN